MGDSAPITTGADPSAWPASPGRPGMLIALGMTGRGPADAPRKATWPVSVPSWFTRANRRGGVSRAPRCISATETCVVPISTETPSPSTSKMLTITSLRRVHKKTQTHSTQTGARGLRAADPSQWAPRAGKGQREPTTSRAIRQPRHKECRRPRPRSDARPRARRVLPVRQSRCGVAAGQGRAPGNGSPAERASSALQPRVPRLTCPRRIPPGIPPTQPRPTWDLWRSRKARTCTAASLGPAQG